MSLKTELNKNITDETPATINIDIPDYDYGRSIFQ